MFGKKKGQATIEYLVLLAVAIIIALVIFAFMGWIPGFAGSLKERQVKLYWASQFPLQIREYKLTTTGLTLQLQNVADYEIAITGMNTSIGSSTNSSDGKILPGQSKIVTFSGITCSTSGDPYELSDISINYDIVNGIQGMKETGDRPLVGTCQ